MKISCTTFSLFLLLIPFATLCAQHKEWPVQFTNGILQTNNNIERATFKKTDISNALFEGRYYVLVQFGRLPSAAGQQQLKQAGILLHHYLPGQAYMAEINLNFDFKKATSFGIISINSIPSFYKIHKQLSKPVPAINKNEQQAIAIHYFGTMEKQAVIKALQMKGAVVVESKYADAQLLLIQHNNAIVDSLATIPFVSSLSLQPLQDKLLNYDSRSAHAVAGLNAWVGKNLNGSGVTIGIGDNADVSTHIDFSGRLINRSPAPATNHGIHVAGTAAGAGLLNPRYRGMAAKSTIVNQYFSDIIVFAPSYIADYNMVVTNNSYHTANAGCEGEGEYNNLSNYGDAQMRQYSQLQHVFASGNDGAATCSPYPRSFGTVKSGWQCAKNILTVGALDVRDNSIASYSGRGPTADGRIKPEITVDGYEVRSTTSYNGYGDNWGTSMASPGASGSLVLLYERYRQKNGGQNPISSLIKAVACNTAEDIGNAGPDYTFGFGMLNARRAVEALDSNRYFISNIADAASNTHNIMVPANTWRLKIMLYWTDRAAMSNAAGSLVNDLDLVAIEPSFALHRPLSLDATPANVNNVATEAPDHVNNIEQVVIENPAAGVYSANINGYNIPFGPQEYVVTYEIIKNSVVVEYPAGGDTWVPGETERIRWNAYGNEGNNFTIEYSIDNGQNWIVINANVPAASRIYNWTVPAVATANARVRISRNGTGLSDESDFNFAILEQPVLTVTNACEGAVELTWPVINAAGNYDVLQLTGDSMQVIGNTSSNNYLITGLDKTKTYWFGIAPKISNVSGRRSVSVSALPNNGPCSLAAFANDVKVDAILEPVTARQLFSTAPNATLPVKVTIKNLGLTTVTGPYNVSYDYGSSVITETVNTAINAGATLTYTFSGMYPVPVEGYLYHFKAWVTKPGDNNHLNDTAYKTVKYINNAPITALPLVEEFETTTNADYKNGEMALGGNKHLDLKTGSTRGRARVFVNSGFALNGSNALTLDQTPYSNVLNADSAIFSYNLSLYNTKQIRFDFYYKNHGQADALANKVWVRGSENNNWVQAYDLFANQAGVGEWKKGIININEVLSNAVPAQTVSSTFQIKIGQQGYNSANSPRPVVDIDDGYTFDNLILNEALNDIGVTAINSPTKAGCGLTMNELVSIKVKNYQATTLHNVQVNYRINNGAVVSEIIPTLPANQTIDYVFNQPANFSNYIDYSLDVWVKYNSDNYASNDSILQYTFHSSPIITDFPYLQDFEANNGNYYTYGTNSTWQWGTPAKTVINKAPSGTKLWTNNLTGNYADNETSYLVSPCFDITGMRFPMLSFSHIYQVEQDYDYAWVEYTTDGKTWIKLGNTNGGTNWYDDTNTNSWNFSNTRWHVASIDIPIRNTTVRFRFVLSSDAGVTEEGMGIDDIRVFEKTDIAGSPLPLQPADAAVPAVEGWVPVWLGDGIANPRYIIGEINSHGQNLGTVTMVPYATNSANVSANQYYLGKNIVVQSTIAPTAPISLRLYFGDAQVDSVLEATGCGACIKPTDAYDIGITGYKGNATDEDGTLQNNTDGNYQFISAQNTLVVPHNQGYYAAFTTNQLGEFWFGKGDITPAINTVCAGGSIAYGTTPGAGSYQWQVNTGSGYTNISNGANYSGATADTLQLINVPTSFTGYQYRCLVNGSLTGIAYTLRFKNLWTGGVSTNWFATGNWSCGVLPDQYTDVVIPTGLSRYPILTANAVIRSVRVMKNASLIINLPVRLDLMGK